MRTRFLAAALLALALPQLVLAQPALVRVFEAKVRSAPAADAPVLHVFPEDAQVSVSETAESGWRKVRLPDGAVGWIEESALSFTVAAPAPEVPKDRAVAALGAATPAPVPVTEVKKTATIYVKDLAHLAELTKSDDVVYPMAQKLETRRRAAIGAGAVGLVASVALMAVGFKRMNDDFDTAFDAPGYQEPSDRGGKVALGGLGLACVTGVVVWAIMPKRNDLLDVLNAWNTRHVDEPFEIGSHEVGRH